MKSIRTKILLCMTSILLVSLAVVGSVSIYLNINSTNETLKQSMLECSEIASERVEQELMAHLNVAIDTGCIARLTNENVTLSDKQEIINQRLDLHGYQWGDIIGTNGISIFNDADYSRFEFFQEAVNGNPHISEPIIDKTAGELSVYVAAPLWKDGVPNSKIVGVIFYVPQETFLNDIVTSVQVSPNGSAYILSADGVTIAHKNSENVLNEENTINDSKTDNALHQLASLEQKMINGESGFGEYSYGGSNKFLAYSPIINSDGWSIGINAPKSDFMGATYVGIAITVVLTVVFCIIAFLLSLVLSNGIGRPMEACTERLELLAKGNLHENVPVVNKKDETGRLAFATETIVETMRGIISDLEYGLNSVANGDFTVKSKVDNLYMGDFQQIKISLSKIVVKLSDTLNMVKTSADQVSVGADQVSAGAQALSQGSTEQAASVEGMASSIKEMTEQLISNSDDSKNTSLTMELVSEEMTKSNKKMQEMTKAMNRINDSSTEIGKIIKTIEDIAFQTNILALNAAVEAARAGDAGKGFAVVADEVRNLASKSAEASKNTSELIKGTLLAINDGTKISDETAETLLSAVKEAQKASKMIDRISGCLKTGASEMTQVTLKVDQISSVVQNNSATAEESAAASEELFGQAQMLQKLIEQFKLLEEKQSNNSNLEN